MVIPFVTRYFKPSALLTVLVLAIGGSILSRLPVGRQLGHGIGYVALIAVSVAISWSFWLGLVNFVAASLWLVPYHPSWERVYHVVVWTNRQIGHVELWFVWGVLALTHTNSLAWQLPLVAAVVLLGEALCGLVAMLLWNDATRVGSGTFYYRRRPVIYATTIIGGTLVLALTPGQIRIAAPLFVAIALGLLVRLIKLGTRVAEKRTKNFSHQAKRDSFRDRQAQVARRTDWLFRLGVALVFIAVGVTSAVMRRAHARDERGVVSDRTECQDEPGGPAGPGDVALWILADTQLHELRGPRFDGQLDLMDAFVPVAIRPVELDLLSEASFLHFARMFDTLSATHPGLRWAHLGDFADLGCRGEVDRFTDLFAGVAPGAHALAGLAPGNHDSTFTGNFAWHPDWDRVCVSGRADKVASDEILAGLLSTGIDPARGGHRLVKKPPSFLALGFSRRSALVSASVLGRARDGGLTRDVIGVFLDSSDQNNFEIGIAGLQGAISRQQIDAVVELVGGLRAQAADPAYIIFFHHPLKEINAAGRKQIDRLVKLLDDGQSRVLALLSAHTHVSQRRSACVGGRQLDEIVVGSTIDPPQEAALLLVGPDADGNLSLSVRTIPAVARAGATCAPDEGVTAEACNDVLTRLHAAPACARLLRVEAGSATCEALQADTSFGERFGSLDEGNHATSPGIIRQNQSLRAGRLLACLCRDGACAVTDPLDEQVVARELRNSVRESNPGDTGATRAAARRTEMTCLAWAASLVQSHKARGMTMADALRCGADDATLAPAKRFVVSPRSEQCE